MVQHYLQIMDGLAMVSRSILERLQAHAVFANLPLYQLTLGVSMPDASHVVQPDAFRPLRILYLGRLEQEQKRVRLFPPIWQQLCASGISCHWTIAGNGPEMAFLKESLKNNPPHQTITFLGVVPYVKVSDVLREHDVFLLASDYEGLPLSLLEAMGHGLVPVVSLLKSGIPEVVDDTNGLLVPINDVAGYARAIIHLHEHREELATKAAAARTRVQTHFSVTAMTDRWLATFPPPPPNLSIIWPQLWQIFSPLTAKKQVLFSPPVRILRRAAKQLQTFLK
jgi:glycosyltransferase involved in cell wall biosynthesis